jgi:ribonucleoside-diphosphate reductase alpha chain
MLNSVAMSVSVALQHGVPLSKFVDLYTFTRFEPAGVVEGHDRVKIGTSVLDAIFRILAIEYLGRDDLAHASPEVAVIDIRADEATVAFERVLSMKDSSALGRAVVEVATKGKAGDRPIVNPYGDTPVCDGCGHFTIRNGVCYKCENCGNSMGCS